MGILPFKILWWWSTSYPRFELKGWFRSFPSRMLENANWGWGHLGPSLGWPWCIWALDSPNSNQAIIKTALHPVFQAFSNTSPSTIASQTITRTLTTIHCSHSPTYFLILPSRCLSDPSKPTSLGWALKQPTYSSKWDVRQQKPNFIISETFFRWKNSTSWSTRSCTEQLLSLPSPKWAWKHLCELSNVISAPYWRDDQPEKLACVNGFETYSTQTENKINPKSSTTAPKDTEIRHQQAWRKIPHIKKLANQD